MTGYQSKRDAAADKLQKPVREALAYLEATIFAFGPDEGAEFDQKAWSALHAAIQAVVAQPAQEPPSEWSAIKAILDEYGLQAIDFVANFKAALAQPAQESLEDLRGALHRIDTVAVGLPTFEVRHEGGLDAFVQNIVDAIVALHEQRKPLTEPECVDEMLKAGFERNSLGWTFTYGRLDYHMLKFARAIEAAHGIKENT